MTITFAYESSILIVSASDSPVLILENDGSEKPITPPPSRIIDDSKLRRVLVLGSKNNVARIRFFKRSVPLVSNLFISSAFSKRDSISCLVKSRIDMKSLPLSEEADNNEIEEKTFVGNRIILSTSPEIDFVQK
jgi:hypothetical protein